MSSRLVLSLVVVGLLLGAAPARAQDSDAPPGALPHWLPTEQWVYQHWLPFDEGRLHAVLGADRGRIWNHLRDDAAHDLSQLGRRRGMSPRQLADRLVAPRRGNVRAATFRLLRSRALRTVTQGHLSQHLLFHSLHQLAIPDRARTIFGVRSEEEYLRLRRAELSPLQIGRLNGRTSREMERAAARALTDYSRRGVRLGAFTGKQARLLLDRQLRQLPRFLGQSRYNGPPKTIGPGAAALPAADFANNPSITADGATVVFDAYEATIPEARARGEISVLRYDRAARALTPVSHAGAKGRLPRSAYNAQVAAGGGVVVFEQAEGNLNFAKRYGAMNVLLSDLTAGLKRRNLSHNGVGLGDRSRTAYNPSVSADGQRVVFEVTDDRRGKTSQNALWLRELASGTVKVLGGGSGYDAVYEPQLSGDGSAVVFTSTDGGSSVFLRRIEDGRTTVIARGAGEPAVSHDAGRVAYTTDGGGLRVRDVRGGATRSIDVGGRAFDPALSPDGRYLVTGVRGNGTRLRSRIVRVDLRGGGVRTIADDGGYATEPAVAADGTSVAYTSTAPAGGKPAGLPGVYLHDVAAATTTRLSTHAPLRKARARGRARAATATATHAYLCDLAL